MKREPTGAAGDSNRSDEPILSRSRSFFSRVANAKPANVGRRSSTGSPVSNKAQIGIAEDINVLVTTTTDVTLGRDDRSLQKADSIAGTAAENVEATLVETRNDQDENNRGSTKQKSPKPAKSRQSRIRDAASGIICRSKSRTKKKKNTFNDTQSSRENSRRYMRKTSIVQHSFIAMGSRSFDVDDGYQNELGTIGKAAGAASAGSKGEYRKRNNGGHTTEEIECVLTHMAVNTSAETEGGNDHEGAAASGVSALGQQSDWFILHADPHLDSASSEGSDSDGNDEDSFDAALEKLEKLDAPAPNPCCSPKQSEAFSGGEEDTEPLPKTKKKKKWRQSSPRYTSGKIVHMSDVLTTERNFDEFLAAYEELGRRYNARHRMDKQASKSTISSSSLFEGKCSFCAVNPHRDMPPIPPEKWPQRPLLMRATPGSGTRVIGVRYSSSTNYLLGPWPTALKHMWSIKQQAQQSDRSGVEVEAFPTLSNRAMEGYNCPQCQVLPINDGTEPLGKSLVIDFESDLFVGTMLIRIKDCHGTSPPLSDGAASIADSETSGHEARHDYFSNKDRKYQAVIRGQFKRPCRVSNCVTGQAFSRPCGNLPSKWILRSAVQIIALFAPLLQADLDGSSAAGTFGDAAIAAEGPSFLSPLASTPQVVLACPVGRNSSSRKLLAFPTESASAELPSKPSRRSAEGGKDTVSAQHALHADGEMEDQLEEPHDPTKSLVAHYHRQTEKNAEATSGENRSSSRPLPKDAHKMSSTSRAKIRKKLFDKLYAKSDPEAEFDTKTIYTFEFLQHLVNFKSFSLEMGGVVGGSMNLVEMLNGQPLKCMGACQEIKTNKQKSNQSGGAKESNVEGKVLRGLWSFDIWHEGLYPEALLHDGKMGS